VGWLIGVDTGGTFTDLVAVHEETRELRFAKVPSTPHDPSLGVMAALEQLLEAGEPLERAFQFRRQDHSCTPFGARWPMKPNMYPATRRIWISSDPSVMR